MLQAANNEQMTSYQSKYCANEQVLRQQMNGADSMIKGGSRQQLPLRGVVYATAEQIEGDW